MSPTGPSPLLQQALVHHQAGRLDEADRLYRQVRQSQPRCFEAWHHSGLIALARNAEGEALKLLQVAAQISPRSVDAQFHLGLALRANGKSPEAVRALQCATQLQPKVALLWFQLGVTFQHSGRLVEASQAYQKALQVEPGHAESLDALGALVADAQSLGHALPYFQESTARHPERAVGWCNLGLSLSHLRRFDEALAALDQAIARDPRLIKARTGKALVLQQLYRIPEAASAFAEAVAVAPTDTEAWSGRLLTLHYVDTLGPAEIAAEHRRFGETLAAAHPPVVVPRRGDRPGARIRVGFLSPDFRSHAVASFFLPLLTHLDRSRLEVFLYHDHATTDAVTEACRQHADHWRHFAGQVHRVVEERIRADHLDLLVDLCGHTGVNRMELLARRLAPVQATYLGYPNTTGLKTMDYRLTDEICDPTGVAEAWHSERLIRFSPCAWSFQPPVDAPEATTHLAEEPPRLGCFNNFAKVTDRTLALWAKVLRALPDAVLCLKAHGLDQATFVQRIEDRLRAHEIDPLRVTYLGRAPTTREHLTAYQQVDVSLDPFPYHGTTSTCESLWMGVPVVTLCGAAHVSRVSASLLTAVGRPEWIATSEEDYVAKVCAVVRTGTRGDAFRGALRGAMRASLLLDAATQGRRFSDALVACATS